MEGESPLCAQHLDNHEIYGHPYAKEVNKQLVHLVDEEGMTKLDALQMLINQYTDKGNRKGLTFKRITLFHIALANHISEKRKVKKWWKTHEDT